jgi:hypothetical protein
MGDKLLGMAILILASSLFLYGTTWTFLMPFLDDDYPYNHSSCPESESDGYLSFLDLHSSASCGFAYYY